jgi:hypothetical protein
MAELSGPFDSVFGRLDCEVGRNVSQGLKHQSYDLMCTPQVWSVLLLILYELNFCIALT